MRRWFDLSTNSPSVVKKLNATFAEKGAHMLDAPVSGGPAGAASGKLAIWVGGEKSAFDRFKPVLDAMGDKAAYIGPIGAATIAKLVHNMSSYAVTCAVAETFALGIKAGVEPLALWNAVRQGAAGRRQTFDVVIDQYLPNNYDPPAFALKLAHKDVSLANQLGRELGLPMRICNLTLAEMTEAMSRGWEGRDSRAVMLLSQERAGISVAVEPEKIKAALAENRSRSLRSFPRSGNPDLSWLGSGSPLSRGRADSLTSDAARDARASAHSLLRHLVGGEMAAAGQHGEFVRR